MEVNKKVIREVLKSNEFHLYFNSLDRKIQTKVVLLNSFLKKDSNQYRQEIEKARRILIKEEII